MRSEVLRHPPGQPFVLMQRSHVAVCGNDPTQGVLLSFFDGWHRTRMNRRPKASLQADAEWQYHSQADIEQGILHLASENTIKKAMIALIERGFIEKKVGLHPWIKGRTITFIRLRVENVQAELDRLYPPTLPVSGDGVKIDPHRVEADPKAVNLEPHEVKSGRSSYIHTLPTSSSIRPATTGLSSDTPVGMPGAVAAGPAGVQWTPEAEQAFLIMTRTKAKAAVDGTEMQVSAKDAADILHEAVRRVANDHLVAVANKLATEFRRATVTRTAGGWWRTAWRKWRQYGPDEAKEELRASNQRRVERQRRSDPGCPQGVSDWKEDMGRAFVQKLTGEQIDALFSWLVDRFTRMSQPKMVELLGETDTMRTNRAVHSVVGSLLRKEPGLLERAVDQSESD